MTFQCSGQLEDDGDGGLIYASFDDAAHPLSPFYRVDAAPTGIVL